MGPISSHEARHLEHELRRNGNHSFHRKGHKPSGRWNHANGFPSLSFFLSRSPTSVDPSPGSSSKDIWPTTSSVSFASSCGDRDPRTDLVGSVPCFDPLSSIGFFRTPGDLKGSRSIIGSGTDGRERSCCTEGRRGSGNEGR